MSKVLLLFLCVPLAHAQVNLNSNIPAPQVKGIVQPVNGGLGVDSSTLSGCGKVVSGVWTVNSANCSGITLTTSGTTGPATLTNNTLNIPQYAGGGSATYINVGSGLTISGNGSVSTPFLISLATSFAINSFAGCVGTVELGHAITNPAFTASYSATPSSAAITNTDGTGSPTNLTTPFTSGTVTGSFSHSAVATTTFTLTAVGSSTQTATCNDAWQPRIFGGIGATGATSSVTASGTTAVLSTTDVLPSVQLGAETVGQIFGPYMPNNQVFYLLLTGGSHTFVDNASGFTIPFNAPIAVSFVNANGVTVTMYLYASTYQSGPGITTNIKVAS